MNTGIKERYKSYTNTVRNFKSFHYGVINMPRPDFSNIPELLKSIKILVSYIDLVEKSKLTKFNYKQLMQYIIEQLKLENYPECRSETFEKRYFKVDIDINELYKNEGRMFRHWMGWLLFFNILKSKSKQKKYLDHDKINEFLYSDEEILMNIYKSNFVEMNIKNNELLKSQKEINIQDNADYKPVVSILKYISSLDRAATAFEVSILLGRVDKLQKQDQILENALNIGTNLPADQGEQINLFFKEMGWTESGRRFTYKSSQEPFFKFNSFLLLMESFDLIKINSTYKTIELTDFSRDLLNETVPIELTVLDELLIKIDDEKLKNLFSIVMKNRNELILQSLNTDSELIVKLNQRAVKFPLLSKGKRIRSRLIKEIAKIQKNYTCEATGVPTFKTPEGFNYVEAHHILEFNTEDGPDITDNLLILGPEKHRLLHNASNIEKEDLYRHLISNGSLQIERFENMIKMYKCLTKKHVEILYEKKIISRYDMDRLTIMVEDYTDKSE